MRRYAGIAALLIVMALAAWLLPDKGGREQRPAEPQSAQAEKTVPIGKTVAVDKPEKRKPQTPVNTPRGRGFDYYVLSLSWSPSFCAGEGASGNDQQCAADKDYGFIVHGLWPQNERDFPEFCSTSEPDRVPDALGRSLFDIMPSMGLIGHEWRKHGSCSGLSQRDYLRTIRAARAAIVIPEDLGDARSRKTMTLPDLQASLFSANPGLGRRGLSITCNGNQLDEIRICLTTDLQFRDCSGAVRQSCPSKTIVLPPAR